MQTQHCACGGEGHGILGKLYRGNFMYTVPNVVCGYILLLSCSVSTLAGGRTYLPANLSGVRGGMPLRDRAQIPILYACTEAEGKVRYG